MKFILFLLPFLVLSNSYASSIEGVKVDLKYDMEFLHNHKHVKSNDPHLFVQAEDISFPDYSSIEINQKEKYDKALSILEKVLNSESFKLKVLAYKRSDGQRLYQKNYLWNDSDQVLSNRDVLDIILNGDEKMRPNTLNEMNINSYVKQCSWFQRMGIWCRKVIGSTSPSSSALIKHNWKFYKGFDTPEMVANIVHEWLHLLGFLHGNENMREEVPYVVGSIAGEVAKEFLSE